MRPSKAITHEKCLMIVEKVYHQLCPRGLPHNDRDDVKQAGWLGVLVAAERFNKKRGITFLTFAWPAVRGQMIFELQRLCKDPQHAASFLRRYRAFYGLNAGFVPEKPPTMETLRTAGLSPAEVRSCYRYFEWRCAATAENTPTIKETRHGYLPPVEEMIAHLRAKDAQAAQAITLRYLQGKAWRTVSRNMGIPFGSIYRIVERGVNILRIQFLEER